MMARISNTTQRDVTGWIRIKKVFSLTFMAVFAAKSAAFDSLSALSRLSVLMDFMSCRMETAPA